MERAAAVVATTERAERGGARVESLHGSPAGTVMLGGGCVALEESQPQGETIE